MNPKKQYDTPENEQLEPKNHPIEKEDYFPNLYVWVPCEFSGVVPRPLRGKK